MGTPDFAVPTLECIVKSGFNVVGVITAPDRQAGRGRKISESAVKKAAVSLGINVLQPTNLKDPIFIDELEKLNPDLQIVVAFRMLPEIVWNMPSLGTFNLHASLLPQYRGAAPINYALINGEKITGITTFFLDKEIDTGKIIKQQEIEIVPEDNLGSLHDRLMMAGAQLVVDTIDYILGEDFNTIDQSAFIKNAILNPAPKLSKSDCLINWNKNSAEINNLIRGLSPYPAAFGNLIYKDGKIQAVKIFNARIIDSESCNKPGTINSDNRTFIHVATTDKQIEIKELQFPGKKRMDVKSALMGFRNISEYSFIC